MARLSFRRLGHCSPPSSPLPPPETEEPRPKTSAEPLSLTVIVLLGLIVVLAAVLRLTGLSQRGFIFWDEAKFALEGIRLLSVLQALPHVQAAGLAGKAVGTAKPTHALLIAMSYSLFGVHDYAPLALNAVMSLGAIIVLFQLGRRIFGINVGLVAALLLAVSGYDIVYARAALSESDATFFFLLAALFWWETRADTAG